MLHLDDVHVQIGGAVLLGGVTLAVRPGEVVAVVGPNGAGKSTLLKVAAGERAPSAGRATLDGRPLAARSPEHLAIRRAVLPQQSALAFGFTAFEVAMLGRTPHAATRDGHEAAAWRALERAGVAHLAERRYPTLSGGEQQRVHLARALAQLDGPAAPDAPRAPRYLLLDEPTASLDLAHQHAVLALARAHAEAGGGVLVVLHDLNLAAQYADRLAVLRGGRLLAEGRPAEVLDPGLVHAAFDVPVVVLPHPCLACPLVVPMPVVAAGGDGAPAAFDPPAFP
jgi:iron complex transport system ATP-binding protein